MTQLNYEKFGKDDIIKWHRKAHMLLLCSQYALCAVYIHDKMILLKSMRILSIDELIRQMDLTEK